MKYRYYIVLIIFLSAALTETLFSVEKTNEWVNYLSNEYLNDIVINEEFIWVGGHGLAKVNTVTEEIIHYDKTNSGLPENKILSLAIDKEGIIWIGTLHYLTKYNGKEWVSYSSTISESIYCVQSIVIDRENNVWFSSENRIIKYDRKNWSIYDKKSTGGIEFNGSIKMAFDSLNNLWICINNDYGNDPEVVRYNGINWDYWNSNELMLNNESVLDVVTDSSRVWFCTQHQIFYFNNSENKFKNYVVFNNFQNISFALDKKHNSIITTCSPDNKEYSLFRIDLNTDNFSKISNLLPYKDTKIIFDNKENIWIGSQDPVNDKKGLAKLKNDNWEMYNYTNFCLTDSFIDDICLDNEGNKWIVTHGRGITFIGKDSCEIIQSTNEIKRLNSYDKIVFDKDNRLWALNSSNIILKSDNIWEEFISRKYPINRTSLSSIFVDHENTIWIGGEKLIRFRNKKWDVFPFQEEIMDTKENQSIFNNLLINSFCEDTISNQLYMGSPRGLISFDYKTEKIYIRTNGLRTKEVISLGRDQKGRIWCGNSNYYFSKDGNHYSSDELVGCLSMFDGQWHYYDSTNSGLPDNVIFVILCDSDNNMWFGTRKGLVKYDGESWTVFNEENSGLPNNYVQSLAFDKHGNLWIGTRRGLAVYREGGVILE
jgi:ligand-binding sensor domain-containing protein